MATDQRWCPHRHRCHWHHRRLGASPRAMSPPAPDSCGPPGPICARGTVSMTPPPPGPPVTGCRAGRPATSPTYALRTTRRPSSMTAALGSAPRPGVDDVDDAYGGSMAGTAATLESLPPPHGCRFPVGAGLPSVATGGDQHPQCHRRAARSAGTDGQRQRGRGVRESRPAYDHPACDHPIPLGASYGRLANLFRRPLYFDVHAPLQ